MPDIQNIPDRNLLQHILILHNIKLFFLLFHKLQRILYRIRKHICHPFFGNKPIGLYLKRLKHIFLIRSNKNNDRLRQNIPYLCRKFHPAHPRHLYIQQKNIKIFPFSYLLHELRASLIYFTMA